MFKLKSGSMHLKKIVLNALLFVLTYLYYGIEQNGFLCKMFVKQTVKWGTL